MEFTALSLLKKKGGDPSRIKKDFSTPLTLLQGIVLAIDDSQSHQQKDPHTENILACIKRTKPIKSSDQMKLGYTLFYVDDVEQHSMNFYAICIWSRKRFFA